MNNEHLQSVIGYIISKDKLERRNSEIFKKHDQKNLKLPERPGNKNVWEKDTVLDLYKKSAIAGSFNQLTRQCQFSLSS